MMCWVFADLRPSAPIVPATVRPSVPTSVTLKPPYQPAGRSYRYIACVLSAPSLQPSLPFQYPSLRASLPPSLPPFLVLSLP